MMRNLAPLLIAIPLLLGGCAPIVFDPGEGAEVVTINTLNHSRHFDVVYQRDTDEGPIRIEQNTWTYFYSLPVNRMELSDWIYMNLEEGTEPANLRAETWMPWWGYFLFIPTLGIVRPDRILYEFDPVEVVFLGDQSTE